MTRKQAGFSVVELMVLLVVIGVLGFVSYGVYNKLGDKSKDTTAAVETASDSTKSSDVAAAPDVNSTADLDKASATLDQTDPEANNSADSQQLESEMAAF